MYISKAGGFAAHFDFTSFLTRLFSSYVATPILHLGYFGLEEISLKFQVFSLVYSLSIIIGYTIATNDIH